MEGLTRDTFITLANDFQVPMVEELITRDQLYIADEVFISGTAAEIVGVRKIDFRQIGDGGVGSITNSLSNTFQETVHGNGARSEEWPAYVC